MFVRLLLLGFISLIFIMGCGPAATHTGAAKAQLQPSVQIVRPAQLIIKFRNHGADPSLTAFVQELSRDAGVELVYVRPMSGGAHVFRVKDITGATQLADIIKRLAKRTDVEYVEEDRIMRHQ